MSETELDFDRFSFGGSPSFLLHCGVWDIHYALGDFALWDLLLWLLNLSEDNSLTRIVRVAAILTSTLNLMDTSSGVGLILPDASISQFSISYENEIDAETLTGTPMLLALVYAVYRYT